jgi:hypothetical protein
MNVRRCRGWEGDTAVEFARSVQYNGSPADEASEEIDDSGKYNSHKLEVDLGNRYEVGLLAPILPTQQGEERLSHLREMR